MNAQLEISLYLAKHSTYSKSFITANHFILSEYFEFIQNNKLNISTDGIYCINKYIYYSSVNKKRSKSYLLQITSFLRKFYRYLENQKKIKKPISHLIVSPKQNMLLVRTMPAYQINFLLDLETKKKLKSFVAIRTLATIELLFSTGMKSSELCNLQNKDIFLKEQYCIIENKSNKRVGFLNKKCQKYLTIYNKLCRQLFPKNTSPYFFITRNMEQLSIGILRHYIKHLFNNCLGVYVTPMTIRHTFAKEILKGTKCLRTTQVLLGHTCVRYTVKYLEFDLSEAKETIKNHHPRMIKRKRTGDVTPPFLKAVKSRGLSHIQ